MKKTISIILLLLSCAYATYAQDSFFNPYSFTYEIEYTSEYDDSISAPEATKIEVKYDKEIKTSMCVITFNGEQKYKGRILDMRLGQNNQTFVLDKYFFDKYDAFLLVVRENEGNSNMKIGMIYYANQSEDSASEKTCYCMMLKDVEKEQKH